MTQNSEQVKAIADYTKRYEKLFGELVDDDKVLFEQFLFDIITEALSTQPTAPTASAEEQAEPTLSAGEIRKQWGYDGKPKQWQEGFDCALREISIFQLQEPLRKAEQTIAEVKRLKLFRKNVLEFLLLSEKQGGIVSSNQCSDMEIAFASADDRFFVVDNSADDKYQNLGFVYRKQ